MVAVPAATPVTIPVVLTVATTVSEEIQGFVVAGVSLPVNWVVNPTSVANVPEIVGKAFMVTTAVVLQPLLLVRVIVAFPADTPVTIPVALTVAIAVFEDVQGFVVAGVPLPVSCVVAPTQADKVPVMVTAAAGFMVISAVLLQPLLLV